eukprot:2018897-Pleurochrysis_carterae.AAC.1
MELAWHWTNWNVRDWLRDHMDPRFRDFSKMRVWVYENNPSVAQNGGVRVTYRADLLPHASSRREPEYKPCE